MGKTWRSESFNDLLPYVDRRVESILVHPEYNGDTFQGYDVALLKLSEPVEYSVHIVPICLLKDDDLLVNKTAWAKGFGLNEERSHPKVLQEVSLPIISNDDCFDWFLESGLTSSSGHYKRVFYNDYKTSIPKVMMCAGYKDGEKDTCDGDSGGPLVVQNEDKNYFLAGITSWGLGCAEKNRPGVYTRVSEVLEWIQEITGIQGIKLPSSQDTKENSGSAHNT